MSHLNMARSYIKYFTGAFHGGRNSATFSVECGRTGAHTEREGLTQKAQSSTLGGVQYLSTCQGTESQVQITKVFSQDIIAEITSCFDCGLPAEQNLVIICTKQSEHCAGLQPLMVKHNPPQLFAHQSGRSGQRSSWGQKGRVWSGRGPP